MKLLILYAGKWLGLFHVSRYLTKNGLRILCYHGIEMDDESSFRPSLFMSEKKFCRRMEYLSRKNYPVLALEQAVNLLRSDGLPDSCVVITFDDGWCGFDDKARDVLLRKSYPVTVYVTSYYCIKRAPIFVLLVQYVFWKAMVKDFDLADLHVKLEGCVDLSVAEDRSRAICRINSLHESMDDKERMRLAEGLCNCLEIEWKYIQDKEIMYLMSPEQVAKVSEQGVDIQLHTHRHRFSEDLELARQEILDNKDILEPLLGKKLSHFCYPSGYWRKSHWGMLEESGVQTATTCDPGFNYKHTPDLALNRFLDGEHIKQIQFEAEVSGFSELMRASRKMFKR